MTKTGEGNREINLNQIVVSKIQTFHSTFGEDNQIYSQEEILERNLLFSSCVTQIAGDPVFDELV